MQRRPAVADLTLSSKTQTSKQRCSFDENSNSLGTRVLGPTSRWRRQSTGNAWDKLTGYAGRWVFAFALFSRVLLRPLSLPLSADFPSSLRLRSSLSSPPALSLLYLAVLLSANSPPGHTVPFQFSFVRYARSVSTSTLRRSRAHAKRPPRKKEVAFKG